MSNTELILLKRCHKAWIHWLTKEKPDIVKTFNVESVSVNSSVDDKKHSQQYQPFSQTKNWYLRTTITFTAIHIWHGVRGMVFSFTLTFRQNIVFKAKVTFTFVEKSASYYFEHQVDSTDIKTPDFCFLLWSFIKWCKFCTRMNTNKRIWKKIYHSWEYYGYFSKTVQTVLKNLKSNFNALVVLNKTVFPLVFYIYNKMAFVGTNIVRIE